MRPSSGQNGLARLVRTTSRPSIDRVASATPHGMTTRPAAPSAAARAVAARPAAGGVDVDAASRPSAPVRADLGGSWPSRQRGCRRRASRPRRALRAAAGFVSAEGPVGFGRAFGRVTPPCSASFTAAGRRADNRMIARPADGTPARRRRSLCPPCTPTFRPVRHARAVGPHACAAPSSAVAIAVAALALAGCVSLTVEPRALLLDSDGHVQVQSLACTGPAFTARLGRTMADSEALDPAAIRLLTWNIHKQDDPGWDRDLTTFAVVERRPAAAGSRARARAAVGGRGRRHALGDGELVPVLGRRHRRGHRQPQDAARELHAARRRAADPDPEVRGHHVVPHCRAVDARSPS